MTRTPAHPAWTRVLRIVGAAAILIGGYAHYDLYHNAGYKGAPVGSMFLLDSISAIVIAVLVLLGPRRIAAFLGFGISFVSLLAFILSRGPGVPTFSGTTFKEPGLTPQNVHLLGIEIALAVILAESAGIIICALLLTSRSAAAPARAT